LKNMCLPTSTRSYIRGNKKGKGGGAKWEEEISTYSGHFEPTIGGAAGKGKTFHRSKAVAKVKDERGRKY